MLDNFFCLPLIEGAKLIAILTVIHGVLIEIFLLQCAEYLRASIYVIIFWSLYGFSSILSAIVLWRGLLMARLLYVRQFLVVFLIYILWALFEHHNFIKDDLWVAMPLWMLYTIFMCYAWYAIVGLIVEIVECANCEDCGVYVTEAHRNGTNV